MKSSSRSWIRQVLFWIHLTCAALFLVDVVEAKNPDSLSTAYQQVAPLVRQSKENSTLKVLSWAVGEQLAAWQGKGYDIEVIDCQFSFSTKNVVIRLHELPQNEPGSPNRRQTEYVLGDIQGRVSKLERSGHRVSVPCSRSNFAGTYAVIQYEKIP